MKFLAPAVLAFLALSGCATNQPPSACAYDATAMLSLDEQAFDQDLSNGGGGWRKIGNIRGCELTSAKLIAAYRKAHPSSSKTLAWHEGQMLASAGEYSSAIPLLESSKKEASRDKAGWNHYVDATVAFLKRDKDALVRARERLAIVPHPGGTDMPPIKNGFIEFPEQPGQPAMRIRWPANIDVVDGLITCFDKPYSDAYETACRPQGS